MSASEGQSEPAVVATAQDRSHGPDHDYRSGSPHLRHAALRSMVVNRLQALVADPVAGTGSCRVLEVGAGHGTFTQVLLDAGASVTVTEASSASAEGLRSQFAGHGRVDVRHGPTGEAVLDAHATGDRVVLIKILQENWRLTTRILSRRGVSDHTEKSHPAGYRVVGQSRGDRTIGQLLSRFFDVHVFTYSSRRSLLHTQGLRQTDLRSGSPLEALRMSRLFKGLGE